MKYLLCVLIFWSASSFASQFRGYSETNQVIRERLINQQSAFQLGSLINQTKDNGPSLLDLLGTYQSSGFGGGFRNGQPKRN